MEHWTQIRKIIYQNQLFVVPKTTSVGSTPSSNVIDALRATLYFPFVIIIIIFPFFPISFKTAHRGINYGTYQLKQWAE
jgi:hypothetical protein